MQRAVLVSCIAKEAVLVSCTAKGAVLVLCTAKGAVLVLCTAKGAILVQEITETSKLCIEATMYNVFDNVDYC